MTVLAWRFSFLRVRGLQKPTGHPLCTYKCNQQEFESLAGYLQAYFRENSLGAMSSLEASGFVLYGAEWFRRMHSGGHWTWDGIFSELGIAHDTPPPQLYRVIQQGLNNWNREVVYVGSQRAFLMTLAAEGGLSLRLLQDPHAHLRRYFRALFEQLELFGRHGTSAEDLAARVKDHLPRGFQHDLVYRISGELAATIWNFSNEIGDCDHPLETLDRLHPGWKDTLPIAIEDDTAEALLKGLVSDATSFVASRRATSLLRANTYIRKTTDGWVLERELKLPSVLSGERLAEAIDMKADELPVRFELAIDDGSERRVIALVSLRQGGDPSFLLEPIRKGVTRYSGDAALHPLQIMGIAAHKILSQTELAGGSELGSLPWAFISVSGRDDRFRMVSRGSVQVRNESAIVAVVSDTKVIPDAETTVVEIGTLPLLDRTLYRICGRVQIDGEGGQYTIRTAAATDEIADYVVRANVFPYPQGAKPIHVGIPRIFAQNQQGTLTRIQERYLQWRPRLEKEKWRAITESCVGEVVIRYVDEGVTRYHEHFRLLPAGVVFTIVDAEQTESGGTYIGAWKIEGTGAVNIGGASGDGLSLFVEQQADDVCRIVVNAKSPTPATINVALTWGDTQQLNVLLPFPAQVVRFLRGATEINSETNVQWHQLARVRAQAISPNKGAQFVVIGNLSAGDIHIEHRESLSLESALSEVAPFTYELNLGDLLNQVELLFASTKDLDAVLRLRIVPKLGIKTYAPKELIVVRFDGAVMEADRVETADDQSLALAAAQQSFVLRDSGKHLIDLASNYCRLQAFLLSDPSARSTLVQTGTSFSFTETLAPGTWVIMGWEGRTSRFRPHLLSIGNLDGKEQESLSEICEIREGKARRSRLDEHLELMGRTPDHPDWEQLMCFFEAVTEVPATTFDVLDRLVEIPDAVALAALRTPRFGELWDCLQHLPFSWSLVPLKSWINAARIHVESIRTSLMQANMAERQVEDLVISSLRNALELAVQRPDMPAMKNVADLIRKEVLGLPIQQPELNMARTTPGLEFIMGLLKEERGRLRQVHADDVWPSWKQCEETARPLAASIPEGLVTKLFGRVSQPYQRPLMFAPILAAIASTSDDITLSRLDIFNIRRMEEFDRIWFRAAHHFAHTCLCALRMGENT